MAPRGLVLPIAGDNRALLRTFKGTEKAAGDFGRKIHQTGVTARQGAEANLQASLKQQGRLRAEINEYKRLGTAAKRGSQEQVAAAHLAAKAQAQLTRSINGTIHEENRLQRTAGKRRHLFGGRELRGGIAASGVLGGAGRALAFGSLGFLGGFGVTQIAKSVITSASTIQEELEKTGVLFGRSEKQVERWAGSLASSFGISEGEALKSAGVFGNIFRSLHFGEQPAAKMSERLVQLAADMASFNNASPEDTLKALQSGLAGQVRPLRAFGVFLSQDRIKQEALNSGIVKNASHLTAAQKVQAAYNIILKDTKLQQGDVARNTGSLSVAQSKLRANLEDSEAIIGKALLPTMVQLANGLARYLSRVNRTGQLQRSLNSAVRTSRAVFSGVRAVVVPLAHAMIGLSHALGGAKNTAKLFATVFIGMKILKWAGEMRVLAASIRGVAAAEALAGAGGLLGGGGKAGLFKKLLLAGGIRGGAIGGAAALGAGGLAAAGGVAAVVLSAGGATGQHGDRRKRYPRMAALSDKASRGGRLSPTEQAALDALGQYSFASAPDSRLQRAEQILKTGLLRGTGESAGAARAGAPHGFTSGADVARGTEATAAGPAGRHRASLAFQISLANEQLAKAELTTGTADNRAALQRLAALTRQKIAKTKDLKDRTQLYQELGGYESQIASLDKDAAGKRQQHAKLEKKAHSDELKALRDREKTLRERIKGIQGQFKDAIDTARQGIGELFGGPVLNPVEDVNKGILGVKGGGGKVNVGTLTADLHAQVTQAAREQRDLARLKRRGAPAELLKELSAQGIAAAPQIHALATASPRAFGAYLKEFGKREHLAIRTARTTMHAGLVTMRATQLQLHFTRHQESQLRHNQPIHIHNKVELDGKVVAANTTKHQTNRDRNNSASRRGRNAGRG
jgi:hypothetical protein